MIARDALIILPGRPHHSDRNRNFVP